MVQPMDTQEDGECGGKIPCSILQGDALKTLG